jgi:hypothetical protein
MQAGEMSIESGGNGDEAARAFEKLEPEEEVML